jgi:hypothetical protein
MSDQPKDPKLERAKDAYEHELGPAADADAGPPLPAAPVPNPVEDEEAGIAP